MKVGVTGATGFVGATLVRRLAEAGHQPVPLVRRAPVDARAVAVGDLADAEVAKAAGQVGPLDALVHLAALTAAGRTSDDAPFRHANVGGTRGALALAQATGARHFVFVSTVKVHGDASPAGHPFREDDPLAPTDAYGRSKVEAEALVREEAPRAGIDWTIVRPPLVYGAGATANFARLARVAASGLPLPLGRIGNRRSIVFVDNLCDFIRIVLTTPAALGETFLVADREDLSTSHLIRALAAASGKRARLVPIPVGLVAGLARIAGKAALADRLFADLAVSRDKGRRLLGWTAPVTVAEALRRTMTAKIG